MVIDDQSVVGRMIKTVLEKDGYIVEPFLDAAPALKRFKEVKHCKPSFFIIV